ncbi:MAG: PqqD family protein [Porticoccaceae bacterium]|nr:PqqD family protein [Porticoccaceae bacterium]
MIYDIPDRLLLQSVADEKVILDPDTGNYYTLDAVGSRMIDLLRDTASIESTVSAMVLEYAVSPQEAETDLIELLDKMAQHGLLQKPGA